MSKNIKAIEKIIAELSLRDFNAQWNKLTGPQKEAVRFGKRNFSYTLSSETMIAREVRDDYLSDKIGEAEYKAFCLQYNRFGTMAY